MVAIMYSKFDGGGNYYNKYESTNPIVKIMMKKYFLDLDKLIVPIKEDITSAFEIGCGEGYVTKHIQNLGINIEGADISDRIIKKAQQIHPSIIFSLGSIYNLQQMDKSFDIIFANEVFEHLDDPNSALEEMKNVSNRYLFISVPNEPFFRFANVMRLKYLQDFGNTPGHINHWSIRSFKQFLLKSNLTIIGINTSTLWIMALCKK